MIKLSTRIKAAWNAFWMNEFSIPIKGYQKVAVLGFHINCDNKDCKHEAGICMSRTIAQFEIRTEDHYHVCEECADKIKGDMVEV